MENRRIRLNLFQACFHGVCSHCVLVSICIHASQNPSCLFALVVWQLNSSWVTRCCDPVFQHLFGKSQHRPPSHLSCSFVSSCVGKCFILTAEVSDPDVDPSSTPLLRFAAESNPQLLFLCLVFPPLEVKSHPVQSSFLCTEWSVTVSAVAEWTQHQPWDC